MKPGMWVPDLHYPNCLNECAPIASENDGELAKDRPHCLKGRRPLLKLKILQLQVWHSKNAEKTCSALHNALANIWFISGMSFSAMLINNYVSEHPNQENQMQWQSCLNAIVADYQKNNQDPSRGDLLQLGKTTFILQEGWEVPAKFEVPD